MQIHQLERLAVIELLKNRYREKIKNLRVASDISWEEETTSEEEEEPDKAIVVRMRGLRNYLAIAAGILLLIMAGGFWFTNRHYSDSALLADAYNFPQFSEVIDFKGGNGVENLLQNGGNAYRDGNYENAIQLLSTIQDTSVHYNAAQFNLGNLFLKTTQSQKAINAFSSIQKGTQYQEEIDWYLALAWLQKNNTTQTKVELEKILQNPKHSFYNKALDLNNSLKSFYRKLLF